MASTITTTTRTSNSPAVFGNGRPGQAEGDDDEPLPFDELYNINIVPSEFFFKFRKELQGVRLGVNLEFYNLEANDFHAKLVFKPSGTDSRWKLICEPLHGDICVLSKKIPLTKYLNLQVGVGHNFLLNAIGWKWKLSTCLGGDGISHIRNKTSVGLCPGVDLRIGWRAEYILPEIQGSVGTGERILSLNYGRLHASIDRVETVITHSS